MTSTGSKKLDGVVETIKANEPQKLQGLALYSRFALAGAVCCSVTHGGLTPVDVYVFFFFLFLGSFYPIANRPLRSTRRRCSGRRKKFNIDADLCEAVDRFCTFS